MLRYRACSIALAALAFWIAPVTAFASAGSIALKYRTLQPGELVIVTTRFTGRPSDVSVHVFDDTIAAYPLSQGRWRAIVGIDLDQEPGKYVLTVEAHTPEATLTRTRTVRVRPKRFRTRRLRVAPRYVNPPPKTLARIEKEAKYLAGVYAGSAPERLWHGRFVRPVPDRANSRFGSRSVFNGQPRSPHSGTDFLSPAGRRVKAPAGGRIVTARDLYFTGNTVVIDHGLGLISVLAHLSKIDVQEGDMVSAGDLVGRVGATGRVTGAHLHWSFKVNGARVDPLAALKLLDTSE